MKCVKFVCLLNVTKTCPCNVYPLESHFYIAKGGYAGVYLFFLFLLQNIDCGYSLEPLPTIYVLSKNKKNIRIFLLKIFIFDNFKNLCILRGRVFVMKQMNYMHLINLISNKRVKPKRG